MDKKTLIKNANRDNSKEIKTVNKNASFWIPLCLMIPAIFFLMFWTIIPLFKVLKDSTESIDNVFYNNSAYLQVWKDPLWWASIRNSLLYSIIVVPTSLIISLVISFSLSNVIKKKARNSFQTIFFLPYVTSAIAISLTFVQILDTNHGIINWIFNLDVPWLQREWKDGLTSVFAVCIFGIWHSLAFQILILLTAMLSIDKRLYDSSAIDGASGKKVFFKVTLPTIENTVWYLFTIGLIGSLKIYPIGLFSTSSEAMLHAPTLLMYVYDSLYTKSSYAKAGAASISLIIVIITFNFVVRKSITITQKTAAKISENRIDNEIEKTKQKTLRSSTEEEYTTEITLKIEELNDEIKGGGIKNE